MSTSMQIEREDLNPCTIKLSIKCSPDQVKAGFERAYKNYSKHVRVPGFRPGTAPKSIIAGMVNKEDLYNAAADEIVRKSITEALKEKDIKPHESPVVEVQKIDEDESVLEYVAKVPLEPKVELGEYKGIEVSIPNQAVTDEEIEKTLEELRKRAGKKEKVTDRGIQEGDMCVLNLKATSGGEGKNFMAMAGQTFEDLDKAVEGLKVEEIKIVELKFPKDFQVKEFAGKKEKVQITVRSVSSVQLPELDDTFAKEAVGEALKSDSLDDLKTKLKERMEIARAELKTEVVNEAIQEAILKGSTVHVPDTMWEAVANQRLREIQVEAQKEGKTIQQVAEESGMSVEELVSKWQEEAKVQVERAVVANTIFRKESLKLTNDDYTQTLIQMGREYNADPRALYEYLKKNKALYEVEVRSVYAKVMSYLRENAKVTEA